METMNRTSSWPLPVNPLVVSRYSGRGGFGGLNTGIKDRRCAAIDREAPINAPVGDQGFAITKEGRCLINLGHLDDHLIVFERIRSGINPQVPASFQNHIAGSRVLRKL